MSQQEKGLGGFWGTAQGREASEGSGAMGSTPPPPPAPRMEVWESSAGCQEVGHREGFSGPASLYWFSWVKPDPGVPGLSCEKRPPGRS